MAIKVQGPDGSTVVFPDGTPPETMTAAMASKFGGPKAAPAAPAKPSPNQAKARSVLSAAEGSFMSDLKNKGYSDSFVNSALVKFKADPRYQKLASAAGVSADGGAGTAIAKVRSVKPVIAKRLANTGTVPQDQRIAAGADARSNANVAALDSQGGSAGNFLTGLKAGVTRGLFGIPERLAAAGEAYLPSAITGNDTNASYGQILDTIRANTDADLGKSTAGNILGQVVSGAGAGKAAAGAVGAVGGRLAASGAPIAQRVGNFLQEMLTLRKGQKVANAAKIVAGGGAQGGTQALGEGSNVGTGIAGGAAGAAVLGTGFKAAQVVTRPFRDFLQLSSASNLLGRLTGATRDQLETRAQAYRDATGAEPTLFELLPLADRNKILSSAVVGRDPIVERASAAIRARANNIGPEMRARAEAILDPRRTQIRDQISDDLTNVGAPDAPETAAAAAAAPVDMLAARAGEANAIMRPHQDTPVVDNFHDLLPTVPGPDGTRIDADPEVSRSIATVAGNIRARPADNPITAGEVGNMIEKLRGWIGKGGNEAAAAENAIAHLEGVLGDNAPDAAAAYRQMTDAYAARSRMAEGMQEGGMTRTRDSVDVGTSNSRARTVRNAYDTPEGSAGRTLGQGNRILGDLTGSPEDTLRATVDIARSRSGRALADNLGAPEAEAIGTAARAQDESAQALAAASQKASGNGGAPADGEMLASAIAGLHPAGFITTKLGALRKLRDLTYIPQNRARVIVDMIFSQDPAMTQRALRAIGNEPNGAAAIKAIAGVVGGLSGEAANQQSTPPTDMVPDDVAAGAPSIDAAPVDAAPPADDATAQPAAAKPGDDPNVPYGRAVITSLFPQAEITSDVRDASDPLSVKNPNSEHVKTQNAVDVRPIKGMSFAQFIGKINDAGYEVVEARDEQKNPIPGLTTGPHWHVVVA